MSRRSQPRDLDLSERTPALAAPAASRVAPRAWRACRRLRSIAAAAAVLATAVVPVEAVKPKYWNHTTEADFRSGSFENVVVTTYGELRLSRAVRPITLGDADVAAVYALVAMPDGTLYAGTGPDGTILRVREGKGEVVATLGRGVQVFALGVRNDQLLVGVSGERASLRTLEADGTLRELLALDDAQYVWAIDVSADGKVYLATGPNGLLVEFDPEAKTSRVLFDSDEANLLSLASIGESLLVGTDPSGLVYRVTRESGQAVVLFDADETEIGAVVADEEGNVYAASAQAVAGAGGEPSSDTPGRPGTGGVTVPLPKPPANDPQPPTVPPPPDVLPDPIPREPVRPPPSPAAASAPGSSPAATRGLTSRDDSTELVEVRQGAVVPTAEKLVSRGDASGPLLDGRRRVGSSPRGSLEASTPDSGWAEPTWWAFEEAIEQQIGPTTADGGDKSDASPAGPRGSEAGEITATASSNAVYRIDPEGFVSELWRGDAVLLSMVRQGDHLLLGTGNDGLVHQLNLETEELSTVAKVESMQVAAMAPLADGRVMLGLANRGGIAEMAAGFAGRGTFTSDVLDAGQVSRFGQMRLLGSLPAGTGLAVRTRSGNVASASAAGWSPWSESASAAQFVPVASPPGRFLQYRVEFTAAAGVSPSLEELAIAYQPPNLPPRVASILVTRGTAGEGPAGSEAKPGVRSVAWDASDPNDDSLRYAIHVRSSPGGEWLLLKDELSEPSYEWDTRGVADGRYRLRVRASDAADNAAGAGRTGERVSESVLVDNTPPVIGDVELARVDAGRVKVVLRVVDRTGTVAGLSFRVGGGDWQKVLPLDTIADSPQEGYEFVVPLAGEGAATLSVRAEDGSGNPAHLPLDVPAFKP